MLYESIIDFAIMLLVLGAAAFVIAMIAHALKRRRRRRMIDPIDHRRWNK